uniref:NAC domain-containing protein n=1 Tax=Soboliphyme baturini TaxID=241478 RepID=A0A183I9W7_9BILA
LISSYLGCDDDKFSDAEVEASEAVEETVYVPSKQDVVLMVRPGMDLSKVVLPTFILEPRSFLEKLADYYYHVDLLAD